MLNKYLIVMSFVFLLFFLLIYNILSVIYAKIQRFLVTYKKNAENVVVS